MAYGKKLGDYGQNYNPIPTGIWYQGRITKLEEVGYTTNPATGKEKWPTVKLELTITAGEHRGRKFFKDFTLTEKALFAITPFLYGLGYTADLEIQNDPAELLRKQPGDLLMHLFGFQNTDHIGKELAFKLTNEVYQGKTYQKPSEYASLESKQMIPTAAPNGDSDEEIPF